jgi:hypothetical protein
LGADEDNCFDDKCAGDDDALEELIAHQEAAYVRKRNILLSLMQIVKHEEVEEAEADAVAFHSIREQFRCQHRKKGERRNVSGIVTQSLEGCVECIHI